jgi:hypothetical protein
MATEESCFVGRGTRCGYPDSARLGFGGAFNKGVI